MSENEPEPVKIVVDLPNGEDGVTGEGLWAKPLGNDLYEIDNSPWHSRFPLSALFPGEFDRFPTIAPGIVEIR